MFYISPTENEGAHRAHEILVLAKNYFFPLKKSKILRNLSRSGRSSSHLDLRNILSVRPHPPYEKSNLFLNEYLGDFMHFETIFFVENDFFKPAHPT